MRRCGAWRAASSRWPSRWRCSWQARRSRRPAQPSCMGHTCRSASPRSNPAGGFRSAVRAGQGVRLGDGRPASGSPARASSARCFCPFVRSLQTRRAESALAKTLAHVKPSLSSRSGKDRTSSSTSSEPLLGEHPHRADRAERSSGGPRETSRRLRRGRNRGAGHQRAWLVQSGGHGGGHARLCRLQPFLHGLVLQYLAPHACGSAQPYPQARRCCPCQAQAMGSLRP
jgi:hypothetical protein